MAQAIVETLDRPASFRRDKTPKIIAPKNGSSERDAILELIEEMKADAQALPMAIEIITPETAKEYLGNNPVNRTISKTLTDGYARDIKSLNWEYTGDPIRFAKDGNLIDGQHRLEGCRKSGIPIVALVIRGFDPKVMDVLDTGRKRTLADYLSLSGMKHTVRVSAMAKWLMYVKNRNISNQQARVRVTPRELHETIKKHPGLETSASFRDNPLGINPSLLATIHYIGYNLLDKQAQANDFVAAFVGGKVSYPNDAAIVWRERLFRMREKKTNLARDLMFRGTVNTWNRFIAREPTETIRIPDAVKFTGLDYSKL